ncbi:MAG: OB-fold nucleic acid binding domain-containing protein, partial [Halobacteria archaeon]|nr:OB-fold nucleic acid binding domain-containing protein [Halobacteria archaeon]
MTESTCDVCGRPTDEGSRLCEEHEGTPVLYHLDDSYGMEMVEEGHAYSGVVNGTVEYGAFVDINSQISGLVHESNLAEPVEEGDELKVRVNEIRENGDLNLIPVHMHDYNEARIGGDDEGGTGGTGELERTPVGSLEDHVGDDVMLEAEISQTRQTGGPTIFTLSDESGVVDCAAFVEAGVRAYPEIDTGDVVRIFGTVETRDGDLQIEADDVQRLEGDEAEEVSTRLEEQLDERAEPPELEPLIDSERIQKLYPGLREVAKAIRKAVFKGRPIILRHHSDTDGISSGAVVERAVVSLIEETNDDPEAPNHLFSRMPSKAPFYEMEDVTRDLNRALR